MSLGACGISYTKKNHYLCFTELRKKAVVFLCQNLIMRCYVTILAEIYSDPIIFGSGQGFVSWTQSDPGFVNPVRSDLIRSGPGFVNTPNKITFNSQWVTYRRVSYLCLHPAPSLSFRFSYCNVICLFQSTPEVTSFRGFLSSLPSLVVGERELGNEFGLEEF